MEGKTENKVTCTLNSENMISRSIMNNKEGAEVYEGDIIIATQTVEYPGSRHDTWEVVSSSLRD